VIIVTGLIFVVLFVVVTTWFVDLCNRPSINDAGFQKAKEWRMRSKLMNREENAGEGKGKVYDTFDTNMCNNHRVAGPGMMLHFRFQRFFIYWPLVWAILWTIIACFHNELFVLGTKKFGTPRHNCILVAWGYETQQRLMWTKVLFLVITYIGSFIAFLLILP